MEKSGRIKYHRIRLICWHNSCRTFCSSYHKSSCRSIPHSLGRRPSKRSWSRTRSSHDHCICLSALNCTPSWKWRMRWVYRTRCCTRHFLVKSWSSLYRHWCYRRSSSQANTVLAYRRRRHSQRWGRKSRRCLREGLFAHKALGWKCLYFSSWSYSLKSSSHRQDRLSAACWWSTLPLLGRKTLSQIRCLLSFRTLFRRCMIPCQLCKCNPPVAHNLLLLRNMRVLFLLSRYRIQRCLSNQWAAALRGNFSVAHLPDLCCANREKTKVWRNSDFVKRYNGN